LGTIAGASGDLEGSSGYLQRALDAFYKVKDVIGAAKVLHNLGIVEQHRGDLQKSLEYKQRSLTLFKKAGADERLPLSYAGLAASFSLAGDYEAAAQNSLEGLRAAEAVDDAYGIAFNSNNLAEAYRLTGKLADAEYHVNNAVHIATANGLSYPLLMSLETRMQLYLDTGELREALEDGKRALRILENTWVQREADEIVKHFLDSFDKLEVRAAQSAQKEVVSLAQSLNLEGVGAALEAWTPEA
jgi:tetratricopeptide (TPR) repeat protein